ncbi:MAG: glycosyltransferase involved in cell wall biosynthesis [Limisphaerales bacterium]
MRILITAIIPTYNEEENIREAIESVGFADEVLLVDSLSTDKTVEIAIDLGARVIQREYINSASQKNWAIPQAKHKWIFLLDADEKASPALQSEIVQILEKGNISERSFWIKRDNWFLGKRVRYSGWQRDKVVRLFHRDCRYEEKHVHAEIVTNGNAGKLKGTIIHNTAKTIMPYIRKWNRYSTWGALDRKEKGQRPGVWEFFVKPWFRFTQQYIFRLGILDGWLGFIICSLDGAGVWMRYVKLWGMNRKEELESSKTNSKIK